MKPKNKFDFRWSKKSYPKKSNLKVFSTFACGGGSTMGYKLAGFDVVGSNDIDPKMEELYKINHNPKHYFLCDIRELSKKKLPEELYNLDILDGSPPCSSFSMAGNRNKDWGKEKKFREGQTNQILDDLFFHFLDLANKFKPKVILAENVRGLLQGNAKGYVVEISNKFKEIGYTLQIFLLNAATMGVPQKRERVFFIAYRNDLKFKPLKLEFNEKPITFGEVQGDKIMTGKDGYPSATKLWAECERGKKLSTVHPKGFFFGSRRLSNNKVVQTIVAGDGSNYLHPDYPKRISDEALGLIQSFPIDYNYNGNNVQYVCGMSVPPVMMANIAQKIKEQWF